MAKKKVKQKRTIGERLLSSVLIALAPVVINYAVDKISQAGKQHKLEQEEGRVRKDVTDSLKK